MNIVLWILQALLALLFVSGGLYKMFAFNELATQMDAIPHIAWQALGLIEVVGGILLVLPGALKWKQSLTPFAAAVLTVETIGLVVLYATYSTKIEAENPLVWSVVMAVLVAIVAIGRRAGGSPTVNAGAR